MSKYIYGIDFGTSNSVLAILNTANGEIVKIFKESSLLYFDQTHCSIGEKAIRDYIGNNMKGRLLKSVKTLLPQSSFSYTYIFGKKYTAEDLVARILIELKQMADAFVREEVKELVLGRPVVFSDDILKDQIAEKRLLKAAEQAGFNQIHLQYEPIAAGFLYEQTLSKEETVLVGDFGGGTSDFTLMKLGKTRTSYTNRSGDILKTGGIHTGGDDFDADIMWHKLVQYFGYGIQYESSGKMLDLPVHIFRTLCQWEQMAFLKEGQLRKKLDVYYSYTNKNDAVKKLIEMIDNNLGFALFQAIEKSKINLSEQTESKIIFKQGNIQIDQTISRKEFSDFTHVNVKKVEMFLDKFLKESGTTVEMIDSVFITGGSSLLEPIQHIFLERFGAQKMQSGDNFNSVALGLALSHQYLNKKAL
jgi:hypothetical chaperone protein